MRRSRCFAYPLLSTLLLSTTACDVRLGHVQYLWALWGIPLLAAFYLFVARRTARLAAKFASPALLARLTVGGQQRRRGLKACLILLACTCAIGALAQPKWGFTWEDVQHEGVDLVIALDVSESMLVQDIATSGKLTRLEQAKREIYDLFKAVNGDRVALVAFAGAAFIECPLTIDYNAAAIFLHDIDTDSIPVRGTDIAAAINVSLKALQSGPRASQAVILITDGEDLGGGAYEAAKQAQAQGVRIFAIGMGRAEGAPIPTAEGGFHRDASGNLVLSHLDEATLQRIAFTTGGHYLRSVSGEIGLENLYKQNIQTTLKSQLGETKRQQRWHERFQWLLAITLLALAWEAILPERVYRPKSVQHG